MTTKEEKAEIVKKMTNAELLKYHDTQVQKFNPIDEEFIYNFQLVTDEIFRRMTYGTKEV